MSDGTVKFNVGGRHFEVSRALVDAHSDTVLGKLVSDTWNGDPGKEVFIDRDGDIFAQILNYLRYGSIELPNTIPRSMFDRELDYFGIMSADGITDQVTFHKMMADAKRKFHTAKMNHDLLFLAYECHYKIYQEIHNNISKCEVTVRVPKGHMCYESLLRAKAGGKDRKMFDDYLERCFGLMVTTDGIRETFVDYVTNLKFTVQMKK